MKCLGIESTAHTFSCAVIDKRGKRGDILSDIRKIYGPPDGEGIHPRAASRHHVENSSAVLVQALQAAKISDLCVLVFEPVKEKILSLVQYFYYLNTMMDS